MSCLNSGRSAKSKPTAAGVGGGADVAVAGGTLELAGLAVGFAPKSDGRMVGPTGACVGKDSSVGRGGAVGDGAAGAAHAISPNKHNANKRRIESSTCRLWLGCLPV